MYNIINSECVEYMKTLKDNSVDCCITDPPYGMGMEHWDHSVPSVEVWKEVIRILKPGAFCLSFCSPQLYHRMACAVEDAGFEIKDQIMWMITTKMPSKNRLKQAHEPIVVAQKPFEDSIDKNFDKWGVGKIDVNNTRVPWDGKPPTGWVKGGARRRAFGKNVLSAFDEKLICEMVIELGKEELDKFSEVLINVCLKDEDYPQNLKIVVNQAYKNCKKDISKLYDGFEKMLKDRTESANPKGRYPSNIIGEVMPEHQKYFYAPRVTRKERGEYNDHPTPKPISLMSYLVKVYCPEGCTVLDPFCGSGSTGIGAVLEGRDFIGVEMEQHYCDISDRRIKEYIKKSLDT